MSEIKYNMSKYKTYEDIDGNFKRISLDLIESTLYQSNVVRDLESDLAQEIKDKVNPLVSELFEDLDSRVISSEGLNEGLTRKLKLDLVDLEIASNIRCVVTSLLKYKALKEEDSIEYINIKYERYPFLARSSKLENLNEIKDMQLEYLRDRNPELAEKWERHRSTRSEKAKTKGESLSEIYEFLRIVLED